MSEESTQEVLDYVVRARKEKLPMNEIANDVLGKYGLSLYQIYKLLHNSGKFEKMTGVYQKRNNEMRTSERNASIVKSYDDGKSIASISRELGLTRQRVHQIIRRDRPELIRKPKANPNNPSEHLDPESNEIYVEAS